VKRKRSDRIEPGLRVFAEQRGLPYMRPLIVSDNAMSIAENTPEFFCELYARAVRNAKSGGLGWVTI
jgi:hypothetical protein